MKDMLLLLAHLLTAIARLLGPGGAKAIVADSLLMKQQLLIINRSRKRAPNLSALDRFLLGFWSLFLSPHHIPRSAIIIRPSTLLRFHETLKKRKYRLLYTSRQRGKPGPKGPSQELIRVIIEMKHRNPGYGCPKIAEQISKLFGIDINKDIVRRILAKYYYPAPDTGGGPSWLTFIGHMKDSLWSMDLFRCESILLKTHWVLVVMDQFTRRIIGFGLHAGDVDGIALCRMFNSAISTIFWNANDLERKLKDYQAYYNLHRTHRSLDGDRPAEVAGVVTKLPIKLNKFRWQSHCQGIYQLPKAA